jgi:glycosyltransferase
MTGVFVSKISIITAVYNAEAVIGDCMASVYQQSHLHEHIIVDGNSTDRTPDYVEAYRTPLTRVISEPDQGIYDAMNKGLRLATGEIIGFLNADDFYPNDTVLEDVYTTMTREDTDSCYGDLVYLKQNNTSEVLRYWRSGSFTPNKFYWGWMPPHPTFFVKRSVYEKFGNFNPALGSAADYELMLRFLLKRKITTSYVPKVLVNMRAGGISNASLRNRLVANKMDREAWRENALQPFPWTIQLKPARKLFQYIACLLPYKLWTN